MSCTSPYTVPRTSVPFDAAPAPPRSRYFSSSATAAFMHSADFRTNGSMSWPEPNRSPTSFMAGSRSSLSVRMAPSCVTSGGSSSTVRAPSPPSPAARRSEAVLPIFSAMASTTSSRTPSLSRLTMRKPARLPGGQDGSTSAALGPPAAPPPPPAAPADSKWAISAGSASGERLNMRPSARSRSRAPSWAYGVISRAFTIAQSRPLATAWCRNAELMTRRAAGASPKLMLLRPRTVKADGNRLFTSSIPSSVLGPAPANSSSPVPSVNVSTSNTNWSSRRPYPFPSSTIISAVRTFCSGVFAMPSGPMHMATAGTPYLAITGARRANREPSPSRFIELIIGRPGTCRTAASTTSGSVESMTSGAATSMLMRFTRDTIKSLSSSRSVVATHTSRQCAPSSTCERARSTRPS